MSPSSNLRENVNFFGLTGARKDRNDENKSKREISREISREILFLLFSLCGFVAPVGVSKKGGCSETVLGLRCSIADNCSIVLD